MPASPRRSALVCLVAAAAVCAALSLLRGLAFWSTSDGAYALTARGLLEGLGLYAEVAAAQPPPVYLAGAGLLAIDDSVTMLRAGLTVAPLVSALLVRLAVLRLTGRAGVALAAGIATPLTPVMLHEHALLTPETLGAPVLLGLALLAARPGAGAAAGALAAAACAVKLSFALPALLVLLASPTPRGRAIRWAVASGTALAVLATGVWGADLWRGIVVAQSQSGWTEPGVLPGLLAQVAWNALPLVVPAATALALHGRAREPLLLRTVTAAALGGLALGLTVVKQGTYVNAVQVAEPPLLVLAACGAAWALGRAAPRLRTAVVAGALLLLAAQSASLLLAPADPRPATRPLAESGPRRLLSDAEVRALAAAARRCPPGAPYPGIPYLALVAGRRAPGDQPDLFILGAAEHERFARRARGELHHACPADAPVIDARGEAR